MDLFYAFNDTYAGLAGISIFSILKNKKESDELTFHIVNSGISDNNITKIKDTIAEFNQEVRIYDMPKFEQSVNNGINIGRWNINVFSKLFVGSILPLDVHKIISIDCDTVVNGSLSDLWEIDMKEVVVAGVNECMSPGYRINLGKQESDYYFNSGLLVLNVDALRIEKYEEKFWQYIENYGSSLKYLDQDVINAVIPQGKMKLLHPKYNAITPIFCLEYDEFMKIRDSKKYYSEKEFYEAKKDPIIIHFTTFFLNSLRPWFNGSEHPKVDVFLSYKAQSLWVDMPLWNDNRTFQEKVKAKILSILPLSIVTVVAAYLHGTVVPNRNFKKMNAIKQPK